VGERENHGSEGSLVTSKESNEKKRQGPRSIGSGGCSDFRHPQVRGEKKLRGEKGKLVTFRHYPLVGEPPKRRRRGALRRSTKSNTKRPQRKSGLAAIILGEKKSFTGRVWGKLGKEKKEGHLPKDRGGERLGYEYSQLTLPREEANGLASHKKARQEGEGGGQKVRCKKRCSLTGPGVSTLLSVYTEKGAGEEATTERGRGT